jgi:hypothetical protein
MIAERFFGSSIAQDLRFFLSGAFPELECKQSAIQTTNGIARRAQRREKTFQPAERPFLVVTPNSAGSSATEAAMCRASSRMNSAVADPQPRSSLK